MNEIGKRGLDGSGGTSGVKGLRMHEKARHGLRENRSRRKRRDPIAAAYSELSMILGCCRAMMRGYGVVHTEVALHRHATADDVRALLREMKRLRPHVERYWMECHDTWWRRWVKPSSVRRAIRRARRALEGKA